MAVLTNIVNEKDYDILQEVYDFEDEMFPTQERSFTSLVNFGPTKMYVIINKIGTGKEEGPETWRVTEVFNLDNSPVFGGYFFTEFEEFKKDPKANMEKLLNEKALNQLNPDA